MSDLWADCLSQLQGQIDPNQFSTFVRPLQADVQKNTMVLYASNFMIVNWVKDRFLTQIEQTARFLSKNPEFCIRIQEGSKPERQTIPTSSIAESTQNIPNVEQEVVPTFRSALNSKYVFANFVEGKSNELAHAVARNVTENYGDKSTNPLFLYGGTGLGKTHLLHATGNAIMANDSNAKVFYTHSEQFIRHVIGAINNNTMEKLKKFYRSLDVLLIDDIQFLARTEKTQEELFHTINTMLENDKQIILTSDRYPKEIEKIEDRLKSRFSWGLSIAVEPPDVETRVAILLKKAEENNIVLPEEVAFFIGQRLRTNVRELEGALNRIKATASFTGKAIDIDFVRDTLKDMLAVQDRLVTIDNIQKIVAEYYRIKVADLKSKVRTKQIAHPRQLAMALAKELTNRSLPEIGKAFGDRDHTTVLHACRAVEKRCKEDTNTQEDYSNLIRTLSV